MIVVFFFFSSRRRHTRLQGDWSSDVCSSDLSLESVANADLHASLAFASLHATSVHALSLQAQGRQILVLQERQVAVQSGALGQVVDVAQSDLVSLGVDGLDRKSTRLNSSHLVISYAVF